jgi:maltooligosyltrehalose trehalohydrolase
MWMRDYHADGLRLDAMQAILDMNAIHIGEEIATATHELAAQLRRRLVVTAESDLNDPGLMQPPELGGYGLDAAWADDVHHALHAALTGERAGYYADFASPGALPRALHDPYLYDGVYSAFRDRQHGRPAGDLQGHRFVACLQNHDQVGNRAHGDRIGQIASPGRARIGAALLLTAPYVPLLFAGEEWNASAPFWYFTDHADPELGRAVREGRRAEFAHRGLDPDEVPDPQNHATFEASKLDWSERSRAPHAEMLDWYRSLVALRREIPELRDGDRDAVRVTGSSDGLLAVERGPVRVVANLGPTPVDLERSGDHRLAWPADIGSVLPPDGIIITVR